MAFSKRGNINPIEPSCKKEMYNSKEDASDMIKYINANFSGKEISAYKCTVCGFWHLTSKKYGNDRRKL